MVESVKRMLKDKRGNAIIETSVMLPLLLGLFMGLVFFTNSFRYKIIANMAAKEGARAYEINLGNASRAISKAEEELALGGVKGASISVVNGGVEVVKPYGFHVPESGNYLLSIKGYHVFKPEIIEEHYKKGW